MGLIKTDKYSEIANLAKLAETELVQEGIFIHGDSELRKTLDGAYLLQESWEKGINPEPQVLYRAACCRRFSKAILAVRNLRQKKQYFKKLTDGSLKYWTTEPSNAKNYEWEIHVFDHFKSAGFDCYLLDPPDVVVRLNTQVGLACKRLNSFSQINKRISEGVTQLKRSSLPGIVAISLDSLALPNLEFPILQAKRVKDVSGFLQSFLAAINKTHQDRVSDRYFKNNRLMAVLYSVGIFTDIETENARFFDARETLIYLNSGLSPYHKNQVYSLRSSWIN